MAFKDGEAYSGFDVGGTTVTMGLVVGGRLVGPISEYPSPSSRTARGTIAAFSEILRDAHTRAAARGLVIRRHGIAMPSPFDHATGVSAMQHKFKGIYGVDIKTPLEAPGTPIAFLNDADAHALGVHMKEHSKEARLIGITLGTGLGSGFIIDGRVVPPDSDEVPNGGEIWDWREPYGGLGLEAAVFKEGLIGTYLASGGKRGTSVKDIMNEARDGKVAAQQAAAVFGQRLGTGLAQASMVFRPTRIVFGGQISKSFDVFGDTMTEAFQAAAGTELHTVQFSQTGLEAGHAAIYGAARHAAQSDRP